MEIGTEISQKIRSAIKAKLIELGAYVDDELPDYIMVMVANKRSQKQMADDLNLFLSTNTEKFTVWLHGLLKKLQSINTDQVPTKPKHKEKQKIEKKKHRPSTSEKNIKTVTENSAPESKKEEQKKQKIIQGKETDGKERITSTVKTGETEPPPEINIIENTDEFNEENKAVEKTEPSEPGKPPPGKVIKPEKSDGKKLAAKSQAQEKSRPVTDKEIKKSSKKKPASFVASVKRKYEEEEEDEEYDPLNPAVGSVASVIRGPTRKSSIPKAMQANRSLLMKAVNDAEKSVTTAKKQEHPSSESSSGMRSDQKPADLRKRLKTAAGLQLISRSKRKGIQDMTYTIDNDVKKPKKSSEDFTELKYTVKNVQTCKVASQKKVKAPAVAPSRMAASALKGISHEAKKEQAKQDEDVEDEEDDGRDMTDSECDSDESEISDEMDESELSENEEAGTDEESNGGSESEYSVDEIEIEVTDRASQTVVNMRSSNLRSAGLVATCSRNCQTDSSELAGPKLSKEKLGEIDSCLFNLFIDNLMPFEFVENESFKLFTKTLQSKYHFPKRKKLIAEMGMMYTSVEEDLKHDLSRSEFHVITHNSWENMASQFYDTVSVHFITKDWDLKRAVVRTSALDENNLVESSAHLLEETSLKWHLPKPLVVVKATDSENSIFEILGWKTVSCFGYCVQDMVGKCLEKAEICDFIQRGRDLIQAVQENEQVLDVFENKKQVLLTAQAQSGKLKIDDGGANWSKTLEMIIKLTEQTPALHAAIMDTDLTNQGVDLRSHLYNFNEQSVLESLVKILSPFKTATDILTNTDGLPTLQKVIPTLIKLEKVLEIDINDSSEIEYVKQLMKAKIQQFLKINREIYLLACLVHPQTKQIGFLTQEDRDFSRSLLLEKVRLECAKEFGKTHKQDEGGAKFKKGKKQNQKQKTSMSEKVEDKDSRCVVMMDDKEVNKTKTEQQPDGSGSDETVSDETSEQNNESFEETGAITQKENEPLDSTSSGKIGEMANLSVTVENDWLDDVIRAPEEQKSPEEVAKIELDVYMAEPASNKNPLSWWKEKCPLYPRISNVAKRILSIPASSMTCDEVFRLTAGEEVLDVRVKPEHVDMMMFLNKNKHLLQ